MEDTLSKLNFPMPFAGIEFVFSFPSHEALVGALAFMSRGCDGLRHQHNVAVQFDAPRPAIWTTDLGASCLTKYVESND